MPITREPQSIDDHGSEESAVRRAPLDQDDAYELQDHEFTLVAEEPVEKHGWPFDEHTAPWSTLPPLPAWATKARALLEPPTLPRPLNDETPTLVEDAGGTFSATALRALREELAQSAREAHARQEHIEQLERSLASAVAARAEAELRSGQATSELLGRVSGQAARIRELESALENVAARREELEAAVEAAKSAEEVARAAAKAADKAALESAKAAEQEALHAKKAEQEALHAKKAAEQEALRAKKAEQEALRAKKAAEAELEAARAALAAEEAARAASVVAEVEQAQVDDDAATPPDTEQESYALAQIPQEDSHEDSHDGPDTSDALAMVASDSDTDLESTVEWITNAAPSVEVTIEVDPNEDSMELELAPAEAVPAETTLEIDPDTDLMEAETAEIAALEPAVDNGRTRTGVRRRAVPRDDLQRIDGIGKRLAERLHSKGVRTFAQIAALRVADLPRFAKQIGVTPERIAREGWLRQARKLKSQAAKRAPKSAAKSTTRSTRSTRSTRTPRKRA